MKRFRFTLQPVSVLRAHRELRAREVFAAAVQAYTRSEQELALVRARVAQFESAVTAGRHQPFSGNDQAQALAAYRQECVAEATSERAMHTARSAMQQRRAEYLDAYRKLEVVKRLEQKARLTHRLDCQREEQAAFDDLAGSRFLSRRTRLSS